MSFKRRTFKWLILPLTALVLYGCGDLAKEEEGAAKISIVSVTGTEILTGIESTSLIFGANEVRLDVGADQTAGTFDAGEGDNIPQVFEPLVEPVTYDTVTLTVLNEPRLGVTSPVTVLIYKVVFTFFDANGNARVFAPQTIQSTNVTVAGGASKAFQILAVPEKMKTTGGGLSDIFLYGDSLDNMYGDNPALEIRAASDWTVYIDVYAKDVENDDEIHTQAVTTFHFINPMPYLGH